jgi:hypothetical protein
VFHHSDTAQLSAYFRGIVMEFNKAEELAAFMPMRGTSTGADLYEDVKKMLRSLDI